jgi:hypothetical protein
MFRKKSNAAPIPDQAPSTPASKDEASQLPTANDTPKAMPSVDNATAAESEPVPQVDASPSSGSLDASADPTASDAASSEKRKRKRKKKTNGQSKDESPEASDGSPIDTSILVPAEAKEGSETPGTTNNSEVQVLPETEEENKSSVTTSYTKEEILASLAKMIENPIEEKEAQTDITSNRRQVLTALIVKYESETNLALINTQFNYLHKFDTLARESLKITYSLGYFSGTQQRADELGQIKTTIKECYENLKNKTFYTPYSAYIHLRASHEQHTKAINDDFDKNSKQKWIAENPILKYATLPLNLFGIGPKTKSSTAEQLEKALQKAAADTPKTKTLSPSSSPTGS